MTLIDCAYADGVGAGDAQLTWAQRFMWDVIVAAGVEPSQFDYLIVRDLSEPVSISAAVGFLRGFVLRHPVLRATVAVTPDGAAVQHVRASGNLQVALFRGAYADSKLLRDVVAGTTATELCRPLLVVADELVVGIAMRISHLATDGWGMRLLTDDLVGSPIASGAVDRSMVTPSPVDVARFEGSADGLAVERRAMDFAAAIYSSCPPTMWPRHRRRPERARFRYGQLRSARLLASIKSLTRDRRLSRAGVLVGGLAAVAASSSGLQSALLFTISSNRFDPTWRGYPGQLSQEAILHVAIGETIAETMRTATVETMRSLQAARYAPATMQAVRQQAEWERGVRFDKLGSAIVLNLLTAEPAAVCDSAVEPAPPTFAWTGSTDRENLGFYLDAFQTATEFVLGVRVDTGLISPREAKAWLHAIEWAIVASAAGDVTPAELRSCLAATAGDGWAVAGASADESWRVLLAGGERVVAEVTGAELVHVQSQSYGGIGSGHVCYVVNPQRVTTAEEIHRAVMAALPASQPALAPSLYIVVTARPTDPDDESAWSHLPAVSRGSGR